MSYQTCCCCELPIVGAIKQSLPVNNRVQFVAKGATEEWGGSAACETCVAFYDGLPDGLTTEQTDKAMESFALALKTVHDDMRHIRSTLAGMIALAQESKDEHDIDAHEAIKGAPPYRERRWR